MIPCGLEARVSDSVLIGDVPLIVRYRTNTDGHHGGVVIGPSPP
jgi:hypothetical protein